MGSIGSRDGRTMQDCYFIGMADNFPVMYGRYANEKVCYSILVLIEMYCMNLLDGC